MLELVIVLAILAISLRLAEPEFATWIANTKIRSFAESMQNTIQFSRSEAVRRNTPVNFQITSTLDNTCSLTTSGKYWVVSAGSNNAAGACGAAVADATAATSSSISAASSGPFIFQKGPPENSLNKINLTASQSVITFNSLGRLIFASGATITPTTYTITSSSGSCVSAGGNIRCLNIVVSPAGQMKMCDPSLTSTTSNNNPMAC